jgi:hypothetical protein
MRCCVGSLLLLLLTGTAQAVDFRWTLGYAQGTSEAIIRNRDDSSLNVYCPSGQTDTTPGMFLKSAKVKPVKDEEVTVQIVVDGRSHAFFFAEIQFEPKTRLGRQSLESLVNALANSRSKHFTVEYPKYGVAEQFSLLDAKRALGSGRKSILAGC